MAMIRPRAALAGIVIAAITTSLAGCGTVFYPERKGQLSGRIDPVVAIADGVGLLFYIIPGVIAYAVDFSNGTIYLPGTSTAGIDTLRFEDELDVGELEQLIAERTGQAVSLDSELVRVERLDTLDEALALVRRPALHDAETTARL